MGASHGRGWEVRATLNTNTGWGCAGLVCVSWALMGRVLVWSGLREAVLELALLGDGGGGGLGWAGLYLVSRHRGRGRLRMCVRTTQKVLLGLT